MPGASCAAVLLYWFYCQTTGLGGSALAVTKKNVLANVEILQLSKVWSLECCIMVLFLELMLLVVESRFEYKKHQSDHTYEIMISDVPLLDSSWTSQEEMALLQSVMDCGFGTCSRTYNHLKKTQEEEPFKCRMSSKVLQCIQDSSACQQCLRQQADIDPGLSPSVRMTSNSDRRSALPLKLSGLPGTEKLSEKEKELYQMEVSARMRPRLLGAPSQTSEGQAWVESHKASSSRFLDSARFDRESEVYGDLA
ncbi:hypothetical protein MJT46_011999 [Ovis ammon polii x Ovis aries]|nr:hypothetical protein MJT46_011999 [Ovis ammon polii x Ovis aries]